ncbi:MAG: endonuclease domain-containing protein [Prevotella sp.]|nr:endonuclease domain-containing protein [Prevotella sp.]
MEEKKRKPFYQTAAPDRYDRLKDFARELRKEMTVAESILWDELRKNPYRLRFRRQHPIFDFIVDFVCMNGMLVVEIDGGYHQESEQMMDDESRTRLLNNMGYTVMRFSNEEVEYQLPLVTQKIYDFILDSEE